MTIKELRALLSQKTGALKALREKAWAKDAPPSDWDAFEAAVTEIESLEKKLGVMEREEAVTASSAKRVDETVVPAAGIGHNSVPAQAAQPQELKAQEIVGTVAAAALMGKNEGINPLKILEREGFQQLHDQLAPHNQKLVNTQVSAQGGILVPQAQIGGIEPLLRGRATFLDAGPTRIGFTGGKFKRGRQSAGASASYVGEGGLKPVSTPAWDAIDMATKKLAGIVLVTEEMLRWSMIELRGFLTNDLVTALGLTMDLNMWMGTGSGTSPLGVFNKSGIQTLASAPFFATDAAPTPGEFDALVAAVTMLMVSNHLYAAQGRWRWVMSYRTALALGAMRLGAEGEGDKAYPEMGNAGSGAGTWYGFPVTITHQIPTNLGVGTNESFLALIDMNHVLFGEEMGINVRWSNQTVINTDGTGDADVYLWQQNEEAVLAESMHDVGLRYSKAVVKVTGLLI